MGDSGSIYLIENLINGKKYVGQHNKPDPKKRWKDHRKCKDDAPLYRAFRKYGLENFRFSVLCICSLNKLTLMEGYYAEVLGTYTWDYPGGYNARECSDAPKISKEALEKLRQFHLGKKKSPESIEKSRLKRTGVKRSPEICEKHRQAQLGKKQSAETIAKRIETRRLNRAKKLASQAGQTPGTQKG